jgi:hypothetical protein
MGYADLVLAADRAAQVLLGGVTATYAPEVGVSVSVVGLFDERYVKITAGSLGGVESCGPAFFCHLADLPVDPESDDPTITIAGTAYHVVERQRDGVGGIRLLLHVGAA